MGGTLFDYDFTNDPIMPDQRVSIDIFTIFARHTFIGELPSIAPQGAPEPSQCGYTCIEIFLEDWKNGGMAFCD